MTREAAIKAMAEAIEGCDSPYNSDFIATTALDALTRWADAQGLAVLVPREATEGMQYAATGRAQMPDAPLYGSIYAVMIDAAPDALGGTMGTTYA